MIAFSNTAIGEVEKMTIETDSSWKCLDIEVDNWNTVYYDDSWWEYAEETSASPAIQSGMPIWYPGNPTKEKAWFRYSFNINADDIISCNTWAGVGASFDGKGSAKLYVNGEFIGTVTNTIRDSSKSIMPGGSGPVGFDMASVLRPGRNVIAAEVESPFREWALSGLLRYETSGSSPAK
ncbi:MAG: hypothetical protein JW999_09120 [Methanotrichaceae archaeon]|nr:hypothetical protein [Methanotrichaceae archaeon]